MVTVENCLFSFAKLQVFTLKCFVTATYTYNINNDFIITKHQNHVQTTLMISLSRVDPERSVHSFVKLASIHYMYLSIIAIWIMQLAIQEKIHKSLHRYILLKLTYT